MAAVADDHDLSSFSVDELAEGNIDWYAAACIYVEETSVLPLLTTGGHRRRGFRGISKLTVDVSTAAFCREVPNRQMYRYFTIDKPPLLSVSLDYIYDNNKNNEERGESCDDDDEEIPPTNLQIQFEHYPEEWPATNQSSHLTWLTTKCQNVMNHSLYGSITCEIIQLCEHELLNFWEVLHQTDDYRLILLPSKMDNLYHSNVGVAINPRTKALQGLVRSRSDDEELLTSDADADYREVNHKERENEAAQRSPTLQYAERALLECWTKLYNSTCPICFETTRCDMGITLPCTCFFCEDCLPQYLHIKVSELDGYKRNPFKCPSLQCRTELCLEKVVKPLISNKDNQLIKRWERNLEFPPCYILDRCPSKSCKSNQIHCDNATTVIGDVHKDEEDGEDDLIIRRTSNDAKNKFIFCEVCDKVWCELCMRRIPRNMTREEHLAQCEIQQMTRFCRRYLRASDEMKLKCEEMYPWIVAYSRGVQDDFGVTAWLLENGQSCPNCAVGVERIEGCFHMTCPTCATHFCYECGQEIFYPFYGTHHCWEEQAMFEQFQ